MTTFCSDPVNEEATRQALDRRIAAEPDAIAPRFERALLWTRRGNADAARQDYLDILARDPGHFAALNNLGTLLYDTGYRTAARTVYGEAVKRHPDRATGHVNLGNLLLGDGALDEARQSFETALRLDPGLAVAHQGLAHTLQDKGETAAAAYHRRLGFTGHSRQTWPCRGDETARRVLVLAAATGGNIPLQSLIDDRRFRTSVVFADFDDPVQPLPPHELVFNAIGDADQSPAALHAAGLLIAGTRAPVINDPAAVLATGRGVNAGRLAAIPGVIMPITARLPRTVPSGGDAAAALARHGLDFPVLLRTPGFHTGRHFECVSDSGAWDAAWATLPGTELLAIQYLDARGADGYARKYRVMMIDGRLYPLHLAVAAHWKVHYFAADMADHAEFRAEEAAFLRDMTGVIGSRGMQALERIRDQLGLDYAGIDFALDRDGSILVFEVNATMTVVPPPDDRKWDYRRPACARVLSAIRDMMLTRIPAARP
ncbi:MAG: tetratricopeptide repeat protein [Azospirillaceae bacterium]|nr:tetratricopeptide repeat protein [Azospirillaceae bacterium]